MTSSRHIRIFDTTLRDGEQAPGATLNRAEKLEIAHQLARLGVDIIEAGFPIASPDDFEAVKAIAAEVDGPRVAGLARAIEKDVTTAWDAVKVAAKAKAPWRASSAKCKLNQHLSPSPFTSPPGRGIFIALKDPPPIYILLQYFLFTVSAFTIGEAFSNQEAYYDLSG